MPLNDYIEKNAVFALQDYLSECGDTQANRNALSRAVKSGKVYRIRYGLYASNAGRFRDMPHSRQVVLKAAIPDAIYCYDSAFELFVGQHNLTRRTAFYTKHPQKPFSFQGHEYKPFPLPESQLLTRGYRQIDGTTVRGTTPEQTIVDSVASPDRCLGVENVLRSVSVVDSINIKELAAILEGTGTSVAARIGWVLEQKQEEWQVAEELLEELRERIGKGPYYFSPSHRRAADSYSKEWRLYFPEPLSTVRAWING